MQTQILLSALPLLILGVFLPSFKLQLIHSKFKMDVNEPTTSKEPTPLDAQTINSSQESNTMNVRKTYQKKEFTDRLTYKEIMQLRQDLTLTQTAVDLKLAETRSMRLRVVTAEDNQQAELVPMATLIQFMKNNSVGLVLPLFEGVMQIGFNTYKLTWKHALDMQRWFEKTGQTRVFDACLFNEAGDQFYFKTDTFEGKPKT